MTKIKKELLNKICKDIEEEYQMGGLSDGLYGDYAKDVAKRYFKTLYKQEMASKIKEIETFRDERISQFFEKQVDWDLDKLSDEEYEIANTLTQLVNILKQNK